ncbi:MAG TPA: thioesterase family protein [Bryobacteraceae bacterium]|nr:thioesterase family protein [Bryobacteraceae bacterium]
MTESAIRFRARYAETDQMGIVHHAVYLSWMEMGRVELCRELGVRYRDMEAQDGILLTVAEAKVRYMAPARFDDLVEVLTTTARSTPRLLEFSYRISNAETQQVLAEGSTTHIYCGRNLRPCKLPERYHENFEVRQRSHADNLEGEPLGRK